MEKNRRNGTGYKPSVFNPSEIADGVLTGAEARACVLVCVRVVVCVSLSMTRLEISWTSKILT